MQIWAVFDFYGPLNNVDHNFNKIPLYINEKGIIKKVLFCINTMVPLF